MNMERGKRWFSSGGLRLALVLAMAQLFSLVQNVQTLTVDSLFCERFALPYGYNCRQYTTMTTDGFLLLAHRISNVPRTTSQRESTTTVQAPAPLPPFCVATAEKPYKKIVDFVRESEQRQSSLTTDVICMSLAPSVYSTAVRHETAPDSAASKEYFVSARIRHRRIGYVPGLSSKSHRHPTKSETTLATAASDNSPLSMDLTKGHQALRKAAPSDPSITLLSSPDHAAHAPQTIDSLDEVAEVPEPNPDTQPESDEHDGMTPATNDSHSVLSPSAALSPSSGPTPATDDSQSMSPSAALSPSNARGTPAESGEPVLLMHHEFQNGDSWFIHVDEDSDQLLPFLLLNAGFDVWVGHQRATYYAHDHATLTPEDQSYWNWTWDEHAKYDMPALLELVKNETGSTVHFVGISQSATAGAAAATMPSVSPVLRSLTLIGPTIYRGNTSSRTLSAWGALLGNKIGKSYYSTEFQNGAFNLTTDFNSALSSLGPVPTLLTDVSGPNCCLGSKYKVKFGNGWDGTTSLKNLMHYQQGIWTNSWSHFDYGTVMNNSLAYDGSPLPPIYDPDDIPASLPVLVIYGGQDNTAPPGGVRQFMSRLSTGPSSNNSAVFVPPYAHFDLLYSVNRTQDVFTPVLQFLERQRTLE